jgi:hypothetical protein
MRPLSASQISTFLSCQRAWSYAYIDGKRPPGTKSTQLGQDIHRELENWTLSAKTPTSAQARAALSHIPAPGIASAEMALDLRTENSPWRGSLDLVYDLDANGAPAKAFTTGHTVVLDFKTTSALSWAKSAEHLANEDTQAALYAAFARSKGAERVSGKWLYLTTKGAAKAHPVSFDFDHATVQKNVDSLDATAAAVQKLYSLRKKTEELPQSLGHCASYGGCFHRETCHKSPMAQSKDSIMSDSNDFASFISARFPSVGAPPPPPVQNAYREQNGPTIGINPPPPPPLPAFIPASPADALRPDDRHGMVAAVRPLTEESTDNRTHDFLASVIGPKAAERIIGQVKAESVLPPPPAAPITIPVHLNRDGSGLGSFTVPEGYTIDFGGRPLVERGTINSPEGPVYAPASPEEAAVMTPVVDTSEKAAPDVLDTMDRTALKALNIRLGLCTESSRFQEPKLRANVREYAQTHNFTVESIIRGDVTFNEIVYTGVMPRGQNVDTSTPPVYVSSGLPPIEDCQFRGEEANRDIDTNIALSMEEREAVQAASQGLTPISITPGTVQRNFDSELKKQEIRDIVRSELERFFAERFGR